MKKALLISALIVFFTLAPHVFAQTSFVPLAPIPGLTEGATADEAGLAKFFNNLYKYAIGLAAVLAVLQITWAGLKISMNRDDISKITDSKGEIYNSIFGLVLVLSPALVFSIINPSILNLSLNLPKLDTKSGGNVQGPLPTCGISETTNCTKPVCNNYRTANCIPLTTETANQEGPYTNQPAGMWCYAVKPFTDSGIEYKFICSTQQSICEKDFKADSNAVGSCTKN